RRRAARPRARLPRSRAPGACPLPRQPAHTPRPSALASADHSGSESLRVPPADRRDEVFAEGAIEVVARLEIPVAARRRVVHVLGPGIDDRLALPIDRERDGGAGEGAEDDVADLFRGRIEGADVVGRALQAIAR